MMTKSISQMPSGHGPLEDYEISLTLDYRANLDHSEMNDTTNIPNPTLDDEVLLKLAIELHRLATGLKRDIQRKAVLPGLSDLAAMRPLQAMLTEALSTLVARGPEAHNDESMRMETDFEVPGYL